MATTCFLRILCTIGLCFALVHGIPEFRTRMPNALAQEGNGLQCLQLGHKSCVPGKLTVNTFGADFKAAGLQWTKEFCEADSDGDGVSNGAELGDPCCVWTPGDGVLPTRDVDLSDPNDPESVPVNESSKVCSEGEAESAGSASKSPGEVGETGKLLPSPEESPLVGVDGLPVADTAPKLSETPVEEVAVDCFAADASVLLQSGIVKKMEHLAVGDVVQVGPREFSEVFMFTHKIRSTLVTHHFVEITTESAHKISLTPGHFIHVHGKSLVRAGEVTIGDLLTTDSGSLSPVVMIERDVVKQGLYNPQTKHGDIVVNGIQASTYTDGCEAGIAHALLAPFRALHPLFARIFQVDSMQSVGS